MKNIVLTAVLGSAILLGINTRSDALTPQFSASRSPAQSAQFVLAPVESVNITLHDGAPSYVVPSGKVLFIEQFIWALESSTTHQRVVVNAENRPAGMGDLALKFDSTQPDTWAPVRPIRVVGDGTSGVHILSNGAADWRDVVVFGYLQDV